MVARLGNKTVPNNINEDGVYTVCAVLPCFVLHALFRVMFKLRLEESIKLLDFSDSKYFRYVRFVSGSQRLLHDCTQEREKLRRLYSKYKWFPLIEVRFEVAIYTR